MIAMVLIHDLVLTIAIIRTIALIYADRVFRSQIFRRRADVHQDAVSVEPGASHPPPTPDNCQNLTNAQQRLRIPIITQELFNSEMAQGMDSVEVFAQER